MKALAVIGSQWGDEGKGRIVDFLAPKADIIVRFNGGNNAGHTVVVGDESFKLSLIPSGVLFKKQLAIAQGVVINPEILVQEIDFFEKRLGRRLELALDWRCHIVMPYHQAWDAATEAWRGKEKVGSLHLGIGYAYSDRTNRFGLRLEDLIDSKKLGQALDRNFDLKKAMITSVYGQKFTLKKEAIFKAYRRYGRRLKPYLADVSRLLSEALHQNRRVLFEGAQGTLLDLAFGTYPYAVGCQTISGAIFSSCGLAPFKLKVLGVVKAYTTRVGGGPFKTEIFGSQAEYIREKGGEYGTVSKRPRRIGWLNLVDLREAARLNGFQQIALTKLDVLSGVKKLKIAVDCSTPGKPVYQTLPGWQEEIGETRKFKDLPENCQKYVRLIESRLKTPLKYLSVGPERKALIKDEQV